jgi:hypothetical protein
MREGFYSVRLAVLAVLHEMRLGRLCSAKHAVVLMESGETRKARCDVLHLQASESSICQVFLPHITLPSQVASNFH